MTREEIIKGLEQFITDFKPFCGNKSDWQRVDDALYILRHDDNSCNRDCANCDLVQGSKELLGMYDLVKKIVKSYERRVIGRWKQLKGDFTTPGGTPYYVCGACDGSGHLHGCEYPRRKVICDTCGRINLYPWEKAYEEGSSMWESDEEEVKSE